MTTATEMPPNISDLASEGLPSPSHPKTPQVQATPPNDATGTTNPPPRETNNTLLSPSEPPSGASKPLKSSLSEGKTKKLFSSSPSSFFNSTKLSLGKLPGSSNKSKNSIPLGFEADLGDIDDDINNLAAEFTADALTERAAEAMKLNDAYVALETMRHENLVVELGVPFDQKRCVQCVMANPPTPQPTLSTISCSDDCSVGTHSSTSSAKLAAAKLYHSLKNTSIRRHYKCLICGSPACRKHLDKTFRKSRINICKQCSPLFSLDFVVDCVSLGADIESEDAENLQRQKIDHIIDVYDRILIMLKYGSQFIDEIAFRLEKNNGKTDKVGAGANSAGVMSGVAGIAAAAVFVTPAGPPLLIASLLFGASAQMTSSGSKFVNYHSKPSKVAFKIISLYNICKSVLTVTAVLRDALLEDRLDLEKYVESMIKEREEDLLEMKTGWFDDNADDSSSDEYDDDDDDDDDDEEDDDGTVTTIVSNNDNDSVSTMDTAKSLGLEPTQTKTSKKLPKINESSEIIISDGTIITKTKNKKSKKKKKKSKISSNSGSDKDPSDSKKRAEEEKAKKDQDETDEIEQNKSVETDGSDTPIINDSITISKTASDDSSNALTITTKDVGDQLDFTKDSIAIAIAKTQADLSKRNVTSKRVVFSEEAISPSREAELKDIKENELMKEKKDKTFKIARFYSRSTLTSSALVSAAAVTALAGAALSVAHVAFEANSLAATIKRIQAGSPSKRAKALRVIKQDLENLPKTEVIVEEWEKYLKKLAEKKMKILEDKEEAELRALGEFDEEAHREKGVEIEEGTDTEEMEAKNEQVIEVKHESGGNEENSNGDKEPKNEQEKFAKTKQQKPQLLESEMTDTMKSMMDIDL